jgi:hypothetical protein
LLPLLISCHNISDKDIYGKYSPVSYKITYDTLTIRRDEYYNRVIFDKNGKKFLNYNAKYLLKSPLTIKFSDFYFNLDKDLTVFPEEVLPNTIIK